MDELAPLGPVYQAGTLSGNPLATAAGLAVLDLLDADAYAWMEAQAEGLAATFTEAFAAAGLTALVPRWGTLVGVFFGPVLPHDFATACTTDEARYTRFFHALLDEGVAMAPGAYEVMFPGLAHDDTVLSAIGEAAARAAIVASSSG
jgi:glutamate-1-semialdehyde 2,1-aminomutase